MGPQCSDPPGDARETSKNLFNVRPNVVSVRCEVEFTLHFPDKTLYVLFFRVWGAHNVKKTLAHALDCGAGGSNGILRVSFSLLECPVEIMHDRVQIKCSGLFGEGRSHLQVRLRFQQLVTTTGWSRERAPSPIRPRNNTSRLASCTNPSRVAAGCVKPFV